MINELISCIITTYNRKNTIKRAIDSVLNQTYKNIELIIVDDASTDGTLEYVSELYANDERIIYIVNEENAGVSGARNIGVNYANGNWIAFQDSDDEWLPDKLEKQAALVNPDDLEIGLVYCQLKKINQDNSSLIWPANNIPDNLKSGYIFLTLLYSTLIGTPTLLVRKSYFQEAGGFNTALKAGEDWEFCVRIAEKYKLILCNEPLVNAYETTGSVSSNRLESFRTHCTTIAKYYPILKEYNTYKKSITFLWILAKSSNIIEEFRSSILLLCKQQEDFDFIQTLT